MDHISDRIIGPDFLAGSHPDVQRRAETSPRALETPIDLAVHENLPELEAEWRAFEETADCTPFQTFEWLSIWQDCIGEARGAVPLVVTGRFETGALAFIVPLSVKSAGRRRELAFLGQDLCDYNAPLLAPDFHDLVGAGRWPSIWRSILRLLAADPRYGFDMVVLEKMPPRLGNQANPFAELSHQTHPDGAFAATLAKSFDEFYTAKRSNSTRKTDKRKRKKFEQAGKIAFITEASPANIEAALRELFREKGRTFERMGARNLFAMPGRAEFYVRLATDAEGLVHVSRLNVGEDCVAVNLGMIFRGTYFHILASHYDGPFAKYGPGIVHLHELFKFAIERGCGTYDFTIGKEPYKLDWADISVDLFDHISCTGLRGCPLVLGLRLKTAAKRHLKSSPRLLALAYRIRAMKPRMRRLLHPSVS